MLSTTIVSLLAFVAPTRKCNYNHFIRNYTCFYRMVWQQHFELEQEKCKHQVESCCCSILDLKKKGRYLLSFLPESKWSPAITFSDQWLHFILLPSPVHCTGKIPEKITKRLPVCRLPSVISSVYFLRSFSITWVLISNLWTRPNT